MSGGSRRIRVLFDAAATDYLWIDSDLAGQSWPLPSDPEVAVGFLPDDDDAHDVDPRDAYGLWREEDSGTKLGAILYEVSIDTPAPVSGFDERDQVFRAPVRAFRAVAGFVAWCKVRQPWIGAYDALPQPVAGVLVEMESGDGYSEESAIGVPFSTLKDRPRPEGPAVRYMDEPPLTAADIEDILLRLAGDELPDAASAFLADAHFALFCSDPRDLKRGILLSAFACEMRIRQRLSECVRPEAKGLLDELFPSQRQARVRVPIWTGSVAKALVGRSLEEEDPGLYEQVGQLVRVRNDLVHEGKLPSEMQVALDAARTGRRLTEWLESWKEAPN